MLLAYTVTMNNRGASTSVLLKVIDLKAFKLTESTVGIRKSSNHLNYMRKWSLGIYVSVRGHQWIAHM